MRPTVREILAIYAIAWLAAAAVGTHGIAYWDAGDYVRLAIRGGTSGLLLGRPLFLAVSRAIVRVAMRLGASGDALEPTLRWAWSTIGASAPPLLVMLASRLGTNRSAAIVAGLSLAVAPSFAHTTHQVLTDAPALALAILALVVVAKDPSSALRAAGAGALLACAIATRETSALAGVALVAVLARNRRNVAILIACTSVVTFLVVLASHGGTLASLRGWLAAMHRSSSSHPLRARDVGMSLVWLLSLGPLPIVFGSIALARWRRASREILCVTVPMAIASALLFLYPDGSFSPRYFLAVAPLAFLLSGAPLLADALATRARVAMAVSLALPLALTPFATRRADAIAAAGNALGPHVDQLPDSTVLVPGHLCPAVGARLAAQDAVRPQRLTLICPGWDWPGDANAVKKSLDSARCAGHEVALDLRTESWEGAREIEARDAVRAYAAAETPRSASVLARFAALPHDDSRCATK